jgi:asparagine synthase (glutamine-hydrolysing)
MEFLTFHAAVLWCRLLRGVDQEGAVWFSSEMKGLHDACVTFGEVLPGQYWDSQRDGRDEHGKPNFQQWYTPAWHDPSNVPTAQLDLEALRSKLIASVDQHLMSDVPLGVLLSGGLDSSLIASITMRLLRERNPDAQLHSFSVGLETSPDLAAARVVAKYLGTVHHEIVFTVEQGLDAIPEVVKSLETFDVTTLRAGTPMWLLGRRVKSLGFGVVLSGEGSDEIFGGYAYFKRCPDATELHAETVRKLKALHMYDNLRANKAMAAWGVEARVPFLSVEFLQHAMEQISPSDKMCGLAAAGRIEKWALREAFKGFLPEEILWRVKDQMSDAVGTAHVDAIKTHSGKLITPEQMDKARYRFPHNTPPNKEAYWFRSLFEDCYPGKCAADCVPGGPSVSCSSSAALAWHPSLRECIDPSGRAIRGEHPAAFLR